MPRPITTRVGARRDEVDAAVRRHLPIARAAVARVMRRHPWIDRAELESEVVWTLARCALRYDPSRGVKFTTYAIRACRQSAADHERRRIRAFRSSRRLPTVALPDDVTLTRTARVSPDIVAMLIAAEERRAADEAIAGLDERARGVLLDRFGGRTYAECGARAGVTKDGARRIESRAVAALRNAMG